MTEQDVDLTMDDTPKDYTDKFWNLLESNMGCLVPSYLKHILRIRGYDNPASIGTLTKKDIDGMQEYFKNKFKSDAGRTINRQIFFHNYHSKFVQSVFEVSNLIQVCAWRNSDWR